MAEKQVSVIIRAKDATQAAFRSALGSVQGFASRASAALTSVTALLGGAALGGLFKKAVTESMDAARAFAQLDLVLGNLGVDAAKVRPEIDAVFASLAKIGGIDDDEAAAALTKLVRISGDYRASLRALPLAANLAKGAQISLDEAAEQVGKALVGNTKSLREYGVTAKDTAGALAQLSTKFGGELERFGTSFEGLVARARTGFGNLLQEIGDVITGNAALGKEITAVTDAFGNLAKWIEKNSDEAAYYLTVTLAVVKALGQSVAGVVRLAFNVGQAAGRMMTAVFQTVKFGVLFTLDEIAASVNGLIENINALPGPDIKWRAPRFQEELADLKRGMRENRDALKEDAGDMADSVLGIWNAWKAVGAAADAAATKQRAAVRAGGGAGGGAGGAGAAPTIAKGSFQQADVGARNRVLSAELPVLVAPTVEVLDPGIEGMVDLLAPVEESFAAASGQLGAALGDTLGAAFAGGFGAAKETAFRALGDILSQMGGKLIAAGLAMKGLLPALSNPFTSGGAMIAAGAILVALGAGLSAIATRGSGGARGGFASSSAGRVGIDRTDALAGAARTTVSVTVPRGQIDPDDPRQRREWSEFLQSLVQTGDVRITYTG